MVFRSFPQLALTVVMASAAAHSYDVRAQTVRDPRASQSEQLVLVRPLRRPPDVPAAVPELPAGARHVKPLTLHVVVHRRTAQARPQVVRQTISRTSDRVHVTAGAGREWLFERNSLDPRRVSGFLIDHGRRTIVEHEESDLRNSLGVNGWAEVLLIGLDPAALGHLTATREARTLAGMRFVRHVPEQKDAALSEVWWNEHQALASAFTIRDAGGTTRTFLERLRGGVDTELIRSPALRFPAYNVVDLPEWLEGR